MAASIELKGRIFTTD